MENDNKTCTIRVDRSVQTIVGSYLAQEIDLDDMDKFPNDGGAGTRLSTFTHELVEQWEKQIGGEPYQTAHAEGIKSEKMLTGSERLNQGQQVQNKDGTITVPVEWKTTTTKINNGWTTVRTQYVTQKITIDPNTGSVVSVTNETTRIERRSTRN